MKPRMPRRPRRIAVQILSLALSAGPVAGQQAVAGANGTTPASPDSSIVARCRAPEHRQFDFWLGRWDVRTPGGQRIGRNEIVRVSGGCALLEHWEGSGGGTGMSLNTYDADSGKWTQRWVGDGATLWLEGGLVDGDMVLTGKAPRSTPRGSVLDRLVWTPLAGGTVQQAWDISTDGGATWTRTFVGIYHPFGGN